MSEVTSTHAASGSNSPYEITPEFDVDPQSPQEPEAHTLELNLEDAERLMPEPTTKAPWFGYDRFADYGEDGWDAVADNSTGDRSSGGRAPAAKASDAASDDGSKSDGGRSPSAAASDPKDVTKAPGCSGPDTVTAGIEVDVKVVKLKVDATWDDSDNDDGSSPGHDRGNKP